MSITFKKPTNQISKRVVLILVSLVYLAINHPLSAKAFSEESFYKTWKGELAKYVSSKGTVNYKEWKKGRKGLDAFVLSLSKFDTTTYNKMSRDEKMALWINAYNAITIKQILDNYPIKRTGLNFYPTNSIRQISGVWDKKKIVMAGRSVSLNDIENKILRKQFDEPLIHFAINCASKSCPVLLQRPYMGKSLDKQLRFSANRFIMDKSRNKFHKDKVELSSIFQWYKKDFLPAKGTDLLKGRSKEDTGIILFTRKHATGEALELLNSNKFRLSFLPYDWSLNEG